MNIPSCLSEQVPQSLTSIHAAQVRIVGGRHPVLDSLKGGMVPNDAQLAASGPRVHIITGPNMGGAQPSSRFRCLMIWEWI